MNIGLFFGSFNPIHLGHLIIAEHMVGMSDMDQLWFVVTPHNPHKRKASLANDYDRLHLVELAIADNPHFRASNVEFNLPQPNYTIDTLAYLRERHSNHHFSLIMGGDNLVSLPKWKNYEQILEHHKIYVYSRPGPDVNHDLEPNQITIIEAPMMHISSTYIRSRISQGESIKYLVHPSVEEYLDQSSLYR